MKNKWIWFCRNKFTKKDVKICPDDYFAKLPELILDKVKISEVLPVDNKTKFLLPEGYFKELSDKVLDRISHDEKLSIKSQLEIFLKVVGFMRLPRCLYWLFLL